MLLKRVLTALVIAPIAVLGVFFLPQTQFAVFVGAIMSVGAWEWGRLAGLGCRSRVAYAVLITCLLPATYLLSSMAILLMGLSWWMTAVVLVFFYPKLTSFWASKSIRCLIGIVILVPAWKAILLLRALPESNYLMLLFLCVIWGADIGAYFFGKAFGNRKLAPKVSPGKSWVGFYGGLATAFLIAVVVLSLVGKPDIFSFQGASFLIGCVFVAMVSVLGDLAVSMFKRNAGVKDTSSLLPGHGGFLDRIDSLLSASPLYALLVLSYGWTL